MVVSWIRFCFSFGWVLDSLIFHVCCLSRLNIDLIWVIWGSFYVNWLISREYFDILIFCGRFELMCLQYRLDTDTGSCKCENVYVFSRCSNSCEGILMKLAGNMQGRWGNTILKEFWKSTERKKRNEEKHAINENPIDLHGDSINSEFNGLDSNFQAWNHLNTLGHIYFFLFLVIWTKFSEIREF